MGKEKRYIIIYDRNGYLLSNKKNTLDPLFDEVIDDDRRGIIF
jgi:hypothetical protein